ncbi:MAG TPA: DUF2306 domain-containing protein [Anaerolineales bacterium]|nr:DUF2306 domain-containing protein [Anaerolineales bacterium]
MKAQMIRSRVVSLGKGIGWVLLLLLAILPVLNSLGYLTLDPDNFTFTEQEAVYMAHITMLMLHIIPAMLAILIGPFQFLPRLRKGRLLKIHRWLGRTYLLSVLIGGIGGLYMAQFAYGGIVSRLGFGVLAILWLYSGYRAYRHIRNKEVETHREWMIRNYALTLAGLMLRVWVPLSTSTAIDFTTAYMFIGWLCWVPNLFVAEWIIRRTRPAQRRGTVLARRERPQPVQADS